MSDQLYDNGAVIGYKPKLEYQKKKDSSFDESSSSEVDNASEQKITYSNTLTSFINNSPSMAIENLDFAIESMKTLIDQLSKAFTKGDWNQYGNISSLLSAIESKNNDYIQKFIDYHKDKLDGSIVPELIGLIYDTETRLEILDKLLKTLYYGQESITTEEAKAIDKSYVAKLKSFEVAGETEKINYMALAYDSLLSKSTSMYSFGVNEKAINITEIVDKKQDIHSDVSKLSLVQKLFNESNQGIKSREEAYKSQQDVEIIRKTLYNYYEKRKSLIEVYSLKSDAPDSDFVNQKAIEYAKEVEIAIENINRVYGGNQQHLEQMEQLESEKYFLLNIYGNFSYNS